MRQVFVMQLRAGFEAEYQSRHEKIWPELTKLLQQYKVSDYHIYLHPVTLQLFAFMSTPNDFDGEGLKREPLMQRWWKSMAPLMETLPGSNEPTSTPLLPMFDME